MSVKYHKARGSEAYRARRFEEAYREFSAAIACGEEEEELYLCYSNRCAALQQLGRWDEALDDAEAVVALKPGFAKGHARLGACLEAKGRRAEAEAALEKAADLDPRTYGRPDRDARRQTAAEAGARALAWLQDPGNRLYVVVVVAGGLLVLWLIVARGRRSSSYYRPPPPSRSYYYGGGGGGGGGLGMMGLGALMVAAWKLPPLFGHPAFFGLNPMTFLWLAQMVLRGGGGGGYYRPRGRGMFGRGRRW